MIYQQHKITRFIQKFGVATIEEAKKNIILRRRKFFGMLFDDIEGDTYSGLPKWLKHSNAEDDMLQNAFNVVLDALLPEFILEFGYQPKILKGQPATVALPHANEDGSNAYIINNAVPLSYPTPKKAHQERFGFLNLDGMQSGVAQFCPVTSIADSQPLCSIKTKSSFKETAPRALNYTMEMDWKPHKCR